MNRIPFSPDEMKVVGWNSNGPFPNLDYHIPIYNSPITRKTNFELLLKGEKPLWMPHFSEFHLFFPICVPDHVARAHTSSSRPLTDEELGGMDMFGVYWEYDADSHSSMVRPGHPMVEDIDSWEDDVEFPDPDEWDWEGVSADTEEMCSDGRIVSAGFMTGFFERLISFVEMGDAMIYMIDEDSQEAVHRLFDRLCELYDKILEHYANDLHVDMIWLHDDWGSQKAPIFSSDTIREMVVPYLKRVVDSAHRRGILVNFHSCGQVESLIPCIIEAGCDMWEGQNNNDKKRMAELYGDKIIINADPPKLTSDMDEAARRTAIEKFVDEYKDLRVYASFRPDMPEDEYGLVYEISRKAYNP